MSNTILIGIAYPIISGQQTRFLQDFTENIEHHVKNMVREVK